MEVPSAIPSAAGQANVPMAAPADTGSWRQTVTREEREHMLREIVSAPCVHAGGLLQDSAF
jgi:hypothetical protein